MAVKLQLAKGDGVGTSLEADGHEDTSGTTGGNTGHGASVAVGGVDQGGVGAGPNTVGCVGGIGAIGVVEPLLAKGMGGNGNRANLVGDVGILLHNPNELLARVVKVELHLIVGVGGGLVTGELQLFNQIFV